MTIHRLFASATIALSILAASCSTAHPPSATPALGKTDPPVIKPTDTQGEKRTQSTGNADENPFAPKPTPASQPALNLNDSNAQAWEAPEWAECYLSGENDEERKLTGINTASGLRGAEKAQAEKEIRLRKSAQFQGNC